jgi:hypothetical protein
VVGGSKMFRRLSDETYWMIVLDFGKEAEIFRFYDSHFDI